MTLTDFKKFKYGLDDIPEGFRLLSGDEFLAHRQACLRVMDDWAICQLTDGKCDGRGYGGIRHKMTRSERNKHGQWVMGEMLIARDSGSPGLKAFAQDVIKRFKTYANGLDSNELVNSYLQYSGKSEYKPFLLVSSCPGDSHGGIHSRVESYCKSAGWSFAPVQFSTNKEAREWKRLWRLQVEEFACDVVAKGKTKVLDVKIAGGGDGCAVERERNMAQWWIDWIKKLGSDIFEDLHGRSQSSPFCPPDCVYIQIGQVVTSEKSFTSFTNGVGKKLEPVRTQGSDFELHTMVLNDSSRYRVFITEYFTFDGGKWVRDAKEMFTSYGSY